MSQRTARQNNTSRHATVVDIADELGISATTVSRALRNQPGMTQKTRDRVKRVAQRLGYIRNTAGSALSTGRTHAIVYVVPETAGRFPSLYHMDVLEGLLDELSPRGYTLTVVSERTLRESGQSMFAVLDHYRADGAVLLPIKNDRPSPPASQFRGPVVIVNRVLEGTNADFVVADDEDGAYRATRHLVDLGHRQIAHIAGPSDNFNTQRRRLGYLRALDDAGIGQDRGLVATTRAVAEEPGYQAMQRLLQSNARFTAAFCSVDVFALGAIRALRGASLRVPDDISIASFDNDTFAELLTPPLTTVRKPRYEMGRTAGRLLVDRINGQQISPSVTATLRTELIVRASTAPPGVAPAIRRK